MMMADMYSHILIVVSSSFEIFLLFLGCCNNLHFKIQSIVEGRAALVGAVLHIIMDYNWLNLCF
jgi:hypothetical protein